MEPGHNPQIKPGDLTGKARIRNTALDLYAAKGEDGTSMRAIAQAAGVTVGLLVHHFGTKDSIRDAVDDLVVDFFAHAIAQAPAATAPLAIAAARNEAVAQMLASHPEVVNYLRRTLLEPGGHRSTLLGKLTTLTHREITALRNAGVASTDRQESSQVIELVVRQVGQLFLQPMIDAMWEHFHGPDAPDTGKPVLAVGIRDGDRGEF
ncbi:MULTISPECIES: TetR/AcrR family transcriptional regulator [Nocardia]|uniref:TetR/AcrR family transcriptional regulator n=1 Tax=Nocardia TaxID=1817 RepID=UPI0007EC12BF|nr:MULTISPECIES: TetR/AcrR family transcriptional regulator [Nocardia]MBF6278397.1 TetR/AcrR family transcriptional regulator [Nocardia nova]OBA47859.1 TetR family transcriptional regulator [Nocardia sp. 852002-51101_SCH5132738]OBB30242.1 TetR family transcriptional regulator [Nocardia sp. 852002-51244_SCH5132740]OBF68016.1 TetR family transcriptional regulator [Mycobacterium sp. 852002-51759_SCH5129042]